MTSGSQNPSLGDAAGRFLSGLPAAEKGTAQQEIYRFVRWFGWGRALAGLTASEVAKYADQLSSSAPDYAKKIELLRAFLVCAKKEGWSQANLAAHLKARKGRAKLQPSPQRGLPEALALTRQGYEEIEAELAELKSKRLQAIDEIRLAAADKDFRENAPLAAAREQRSHLEGRIRELEETLRLATIIGDKQEAALKANIGGSVMLHDLDSGEELRYTIVSPKEVDPAKGRISSVSPIGKAIIGREQGDTVEVVTPAGKLRYQLKQVY